MSHSKEQIGYDYFAGFRNGLGRFKLIPRKELLMASLFFGAGLLSEGAAIKAFAYDPFSEAKVAKAVVVPGENDARIDYEKLPEVIQFNAIQKDVITALDQGDQEKTSEIIASNEFQTAYQEALQRVENEKSPQIEINLHSQDKLPQVFARMILTFLLRSRELMHLY